MKKIFYTIMFSLPFFTACEEADFGDKAAAPQSWEQEAALTIPTLSVSATGSIDLATATDSVAILSYTTAGNMPEGTALGNFRLKVTPADDEGAEVVELKADANGKVATTDLQALIENAYGKRPVERTFNAAVYGYLMKGGQASLLEAGSITISATPQAPHISSAYYLVGDMCGWSAETMVKFSHSDADVYENPNFTIMFTTTADNQYWKIIPQEHVDEGNIWGTNVVGTAEDGDANLEGKLVNENAQAGKIEKAGMYKMTINMMDYTYKISAIAPEYFILGDTPFAWNVNDKTFMMYPESKTVHSYTTNFAGNIKMINSNDMGTDNWNACYGTPVDGDTSLSAILAQNAGAIKVPEAGYYTLTVDFADMAYTWTKLASQAPTEYDQISLVGAFNGWNQADTQYDMEEIAPHNWYIGNVELAGGELKFNANDAWTDSWGNPDANIGNQNYGVANYNDGNMTVPAGTYNVFFNDITGEFVFQSL